MKETSHFGYQRNKDEEYKANNNNRINPFSIKNNQQLVFGNKNNFNDQKIRVTFLNGTQNYNRNQHIQPTNKPKYNISEEVAQKQKIDHINKKDQKKSHIQIIDVKEMYGLGGQVLYSFFREENRKQAEKVDNNGNKLNNSRAPIFKNSRSRSKNKKLKIFPQKYQKIQNITFKQISYEQRQEINKLKKELQMLRQQLRYQSSKKSDSYKQKSQPLSRNSDGFSLQRLQAQRTKRLSQLNNFNQTLYNQLAWKLKQVSNTQYQIYLEQSNVNKQFLQSIFQHQSVNKVKSVNNNFVQGKYNQTQPISQKKTFQNDQIINSDFKNTRKNSKNQHDFIDIKQFQQKYQRQYNQSKRSQKQNKVSQNDKNDEAQRQQRIISPFLIKQNKDMTLDFQQIRQNDPQIDVQIKEIQKQKRIQAFTFNKQNKLRAKHYSRQKYNQIPIYNQPEGKNLILKNGFNSQFQQTTKNIFNKKGSSSQMKQKNIKDFNAQIEDKILRRRFISTYGGGKYDTQLKSFNY